MGRPGKKADRLAQVSAPPEFAASEFVLREGITPEQAYAALAPRAHRKRFGQFFTPPSIAALMADWVCANGPKAVLDPAVGPGVFVRAVLERAPEAHVTAIDIDPLALAAAGRALEARRGRVRLVRADFLLWGSPGRFDAVIANPPYLRHHDMDYGSQVLESLSKAGGVKLTRLTNAYGLFLLESCRRLRAGGRAALLVPGEWTNANFGRPLKDFLLGNGLLRHVIYYSHAGLLFEDALTTACVLLVEKPDGAGRGGDVVATHFVANPVESPGLRALLDGAPRPGVVARRFPAEALRREPKWDFLLRSGPAEDEPGYVPLSRLATTRRGIATGANRFFHVSPSRAAALRLSRRHLKPCVGRASDVAGSVFDGADLRALRVRDRPALLVDFAHDLTEHDLAYLRAGEDEGLPRRFLLAARGPWYRMEARPPSPIWAAVFGRDTLRFILNEAGAFNLTTFHCVYPTSPRPPFAAALVGCLNSPTVQRRARAQTRVYGGGLIKFEPRDLLDVRVPDLSAVPDETLDRLAAANRRLDRALRGRDETALVAARSDLDRAVETAAREAAALTECPSGP